MRSLRTDSPGLAAFMAIGCLLWSLALAIAGVLLSRWGVRALARRPTPPTPRVLWVAGLPALGPRPFLVMAPSGTDYSFIVQRRDEGCALRLYAKEKGFTSYVNNMNFIETRLIDRCECAE